MKKLLMLAAGMVVVAGAGAVWAGQKLGAKEARALAECSSPQTRAGLRDAILTRVAARGGPTDVGYVLTLDTPQVESVNADADRTLCGGVARLSVPESLREQLDGVSELSDQVRYTIEPAADGGGRVIALLHGGDVMANWLGAPPPPPAPPTADFMRAVYGVETEETERVEADLEEAPPSRPETTRISEPRTPAPIRTVAARAEPAPRATAPRTTPRATPTRETPRTTAPRATAPRPTAPRATPPRPTAPRVTPTPPARAAARPSFDCGQARTSTERMICGDATLAALDARMAQRYGRMLNNVNGKVADLLRDDQRAWLRRRNGCTTRACLEREYDFRARTLDRGW